jgi:importin subunit beta-1
LKDGEKQELVFPAVETIVDLICRSATDPNRTDEVVTTAIGLLGDLGAVYHGKVQAIYRFPQVATIIQEGLKDPETSKVATWTQEVSR